jgi:hypothetical protein
MNTEIVGRRKFFSFPKLKASIPTLEYTRSYIWREEDSYFPGESDRSMDFTTHPHLMPKVGVRAFLVPSTPTPQITSLRVQRQLYLLHLCRSGNAGARRLTLNSVKCVFRFAFLFLAPWDGCKNHMKNYLNYV